MEKPTIVLGADVYHAPPDSDRASFAAVVGSMDRWLGAYYSTVAAQQASGTGSSAGSSTGSTVAGGRQYGCRRAVLHTVTQPWVVAMLWLQAHKEVRVLTLPLPLPLGRRARR